MTMKITKQKTISGDKLWNANYCKVMVANFSLFFAFYLLTPLLPLYLSENFGASKDVIGIVLSGYTITAMLMRPFSGFLVDSFSRRKILLLCFALYFTCFAGYLVPGTLLWFFIVRTLHGGPFGASTVANSTVAIDVLPSSRRMEGVGYYGLSNNVATAIAPTVGLLIYHHTNDFSLLFWLAFVVAGMGLAVNSTVKIPVRPLVSGKLNISLDRFFLLRGWMLGMNMLFMGICYGVLSNYLAIYGKEVMGITSGTGLFFMILSTGLFLSRLQGAKTLRKGRLTFNAAVGMAVSSCGYVLFVACPNMFGYYGSALLIGIGNGHLWPAFQNMILNIAGKNERGTANSTILTSWDFGMGIGVVLGGVLAEHTSYQTAFWTVAAIHLVGAMVYSLFTLRKYRQLTGKQTMDYKS